MEWACSGLVDIFRNRNTIHDKVDGSPSILRAEESQQSDTRLICQDRKASRGLRLTMYPAHNLAGHVLFAAREHVVAVLYLQSVNTANTLLKINEHLVCGH